NHINAARKKNYISMTPQLKAPSGTHQHNHPHKCKKYIGTLLSSQTSLPPKRTHTKSTCSFKSFEKIFVRACFPAASLPWTLSQGGALSVALTHMNLHTGITFHKSPGRTTF
ncbi:MAG: hypothetical protein PUJ73_04655, partial [Mycobacteriaceae bacterium]|nr:hypothetical protein [Mycobacteriaceae bacterium]MDY5829295.1 hypothetical protein [Corynebacterium sp.]